MLYFSNKINPYWITRRCLDFNKKFCKAQKNTFESTEATPERKRCGQSCFVICGADEKMVWWGQKDGVVRTKRWCGADEKMVWCGRKDGCGADEKMVWCGQKDGVVRKKRWLWCGRKDGVVCLPSLPSLFVFSNKKVEMKFSLKL